MCKAISRSASSYLQLVTSEKSAMCKVLPGWPSNVHVTKLSDSAIAPMQDPVRPVQLNYMQQALSLEA